MRLLQTPTFIRQKKRLHKNQIKELDGAVRKILSDPSIGVNKRGDLAGVRVYKFRMVGQLVLLAYEVFEDKATLILLAFGVHENCYRDLKR